MWSIPTTHPKTVSQSGHITVFTKPHGSQTIVREPCRRQLSPARFSDDLLSGRRAHQQERRPLIYLPMKSSPENSITRTHTRPYPSISGLAREFKHWRMTARVELFLHTPPPASASAVNKPFHPHHAPHRSRKSPSFSVFLSSHCYWVHLSPESPLFFVFSRAPRHFQDLGS